MANTNRKKYNQIIWYEPNSSPRTRMPSIDPETWKLQKARIIFLYVEHNKTLDQVIEQLDVEGLCLSRHQLILQLHKWGVRKQPSRRSSQTTSTKLRSISAKERSDPNHLTEVTSTPVLAGVTENNVAMGCDTNLDPMGGSAKHISGDPFAATKTSVVSSDEDTIHLIPVWPSRDIPMSIQQQLQCNGNAFGLSSLRTTNTFSRQVRCTPTSTSDMSPFFDNGTYGSVPRHGRNEGDPTGWYNHSTPCTSKYPSPPLVLLNLASHNLTNDTRPTNYWQPDDAVNGFSSGHTIFEQDSDFDVNMANTFTELNDPVLSAPFGNSVPLEATDVNFNFVTPGRQFTKDVRAFSPGYHRCSCCNGKCVSQNP